MGEAARWLGVAPHVLRYWEEGLDALKPPRSPSGQRRYRPSDLQLLARVAELIYGRGFTLAGAASALAEGLPASPQAQRGSDPTRAAGVQAALKEAESMLSWLDRRASALAEGENFGPDEKAD